jgi:hypothetical protein
MDEQTSDSIAVRPPFPFLAVKWYGYALSLIFLLYGGVSLILGVLDRDYTQTGKLLVFLAVGIVLTMIVLAFRDHKSWGWYGLIGLHGLIIILALFHPTNPYNWVLIVLSGVSLALLWSPKTKGEIF